jgi:hypothetical protein
MIVLTPFKGGGDMNPNPDINDVLRRFNRDTASLVVWILGGLTFAALAFAVLIPDPSQRMTGLRRRAIQAASTPSLAANAAKVAEVVDSNAKRSANQVPLGTSTHVDQGSIESSSKESHAQTEAAAGSTPAPILVVPEPSPGIATANVSNLPPAQQKESAQAIRAKAPYRRSKSSGVLRDADVKKRLIELWHQSLARAEKEEARSWAIFPKLDRKKKAAFIAPKQPGSLRYQVSKGGAEKAPKSSGPGEVSTTR